MHPSDQCTVDIYHLISASQLSAEHKAAVQVEEERTKEEIKRRKAEEKQRRREEYLAQQKAARETEELKRRSQREEDDEPLEEVAERPPKLQEKGDSCVSVGASILHCCLVMHSIESTVQMSFLFFWTPTCLNDVFCKNDFVLILNMPFNSIGVNMATVPNYFGLTQ